MHRELTGLTPRRTFVAAGGPAAMAASIGLAALPVAAPWVWAIAAAPYGLAAAAGAVRTWRTVPYWRLDDAGLGRYAGTGEPEPFYPLEEIATVEVTADEGLTIFDRDGFRIGSHSLNGLGFDLFPFWLVARQLGISVEVVDPVRAVTAAGWPSGAVPTEARPPGRRSPAEAAFLALEARLLQAQHEEPGPVRHTGAVVVTGRGPERGRIGRIAVRRGALAVLGLGLFADLARPGAPAADGYHALAAAAFAVGLWALVRLTRIGRENSVPRWSATPERLEVTRPAVGRYSVATADLAAVVPSRGLVIDPVTGKPRPGRSLYVFDHSGHHMASLPCDGVDHDELSRALRGRGVRWIELGARRHEAIGGDEPGYGLESLPDIFQQAPHGRLSVDAEGLHWFDEGAGVRLTIEAEQIGAVQLHTRSGHAWGRFRDREGATILEAPLRALRIARTELREAARRAGLTVIDPEYDAFASAVFHQSVSGLRTEDGAEPPSPAVPSSPVEPPSPAEPPSPVEPAARASGQGPGGMVELPVTLRTRGTTFLAMPLLLAVLAGLLLLPTAGTMHDKTRAVEALLTAAAVGVVLAGWLDGRRLRIRVGEGGLAAVGRRGAVVWEHEREAVGAVGVLVIERVERLVVWSPTGRELRREYLDVDAEGLREACERHGIPWGRPRPAGEFAPPPEL